jgi:DNA-binding IclR family transcriptional regulator
VGFGVSVFEVGSAYLRSEPLQRLGRHILIELTGETSHLAMLQPAANFVGATG